MQVNPIIFKVLIIFLISCWFGIIIRFIIAIIALKLKKYKLARLLYSMLYLEIPIKYFENKIYYCCDRILSNSLNNKTCLSSEKCKCWSCPKYSTYLKFKKRSK